MSLIAVLPILGGSRKRAQQILSESDLFLSGCEFLLNGSSLEAASIGFTDELVREILVSRNAACLQLYACPKDFVNEVMKRAEFYGVESRVKDVTS